MKTLLQIDASARVNRSLSRTMTQAFADAWTQYRADDRFIVRDVALNPPTAINEDWIASAFTPEVERTPEQVEALAESDDLIEELLSADIIVIGSPMYNYGMPAALKAWLDQVIRVGRTFSFDLARGAQPIEPIQTGKILIVLTASGEGGFGPGGYNASQNHLDTALITASRLLGVTEHHVIRIEYQEFGDDRHEQSKQTAHEAIRVLVEKLTS